MTPSPPLFIEQLSRGHELTTFDCGNSVLNAWLRKYAWVNQQADSARTYVAVRKDRVAGYYALTAGSVEKKESPERVAKGLANHPVGVALLGRLAVDRQAKGQGLGKALLMDALTRIDAAADIIGIRAVLVHAIDDSARLFYEHFGFEPSPLDPFQLMLQMKDLRRAIREKRSV